MRIAIIEDNTALANGIAHEMRDDGHAVNVIGDGEQALDFLLQDSADLVILDVNLPSKDGFEILRSLRKSGDQVPIILLTARDEVKDRVTGLNAGADDYLIKPFEMEELQARIRALMRRKPMADGNLVEMGALTYDRAGRRLIAGDTDVELPRRELAVFECLFERPNQIVPKTVLADHLYGVGAEVEERVVEVYVSRLRKKLAPYNISIKAARGLGYLMAVPK